MYICNCIYVYTFINTQICEDQPWTEIDGDLVLPQSHQRMEHEGKESWYHKRGGLWWKWSHIE